MYEIISLIVILLEWVDDVDYDDDDQNDHLHQLRPSVWRLVNFSYVIANPN